MSEPRTILIFSREEDEVNEKIRSTLLRVACQPVFVRTIGDVVNRVRYGQFDILLFIDPQINDFLLVVNKVEMADSVHIIVSTDQYVNDMEIDTNCPVHVIGYPLEMKEFGEIYEKMSQRALSRKKVLIVEDEAINQDIIKSLLTNFSCDSWIAEDGVTALDMVQAEKPDLILLDLMLPKMNGDQVLYWVRGRYSKEELPVLVISSQEDKKNIMCVAKLGVHGYLVKPFDREQFVSKLTELIGD